MMTLRMRTSTLLASLALSALLAGCTSPAPHYTPSIDNVEMLKKGELNALKVGKVGVTPGMPGAHEMGLRGVSMVSPVGAHYGDYLAAALRQELELAKRQDPGAPLEVSGTLTRNNIDAGGISTNAGQIEARFLVKRLEQVRYDQVKKAELQWESAFAGAVAVPLAANNYALMVQKLLNSLFSDPDFITATQK